jgi:hypothetical protein
VKKERIGKVKKAGTTSRSTEGKVEIGVESKIDG